MRLLDRLRDVERVGARRLEDRRVPAAGLPFEREDLAVGLRAELDAADVATRVISPLRCRS